MSFHVTNTLIFSGKVSHVKIFTLTGVIFNSTTAAQRRARLRWRRRQNDATDKPAERNTACGGVQCKEPNEENNTGVNHVVLPAPQETNDLICILAAMFYFTCAINYSHKVLTSCHKQQYDALKGFSCFQLPRVDLLLALYDGLDDLWWFD